MVKRKTVDSDSFTGFDRTAMQFWYELAAEMNKEWFTANKERYETRWVRPMTALMHAVRAKLEICITATVRSLAMLSACSFSGGCHDEDRTTSIASAKPSPPAALVM